MSEIGHECHCDDYTDCVLLFLSLSTVWCSTVLEMRTLVTTRRHADDFHDVAHIRDEKYVFDLPMTGSSTRQHRSSIRRQAGDGDVNLADVLPTLKSYPGSWKRDMCGRMESNACWRGNVEACERHRQNTCGKLEAPARAGRNRRHR